MDPYLIGIDIGTGSTKAVALDIAGKVCFTTQAAYPSSHPKDGWHEQAPEQIWQAFVKCICRVIENMQTQPVAISLSSAMHSVLPVSEKGEPLMDMITWADKRAADIAEQIKTSAIAETLYEQTGTPIHAMSPLCKIIWLRNHHKNLFDKAHKFISVKEYIWFRLFSVYEVDYSIASATGLFDIERLSWNESALHLASIHANQLSQAVSTKHFRSGISERLAGETGISQNVRFVIGASDGCLANLGSFATQAGVAALTIGTSGAIRVGNTRPTFNFKAMTFNYLLEENSFISGGPINNGGIILKWYVECFLKKSLTTADDYHLILKEIENISAGADGLTFLPYLLGERAPIWNSNACGLFFGIRASHQQAHFTRAVIEGITFALYHVTDELEKAGLPVNVIHVSGGFVHSRAWLQILADVFNKKVCLIHADDASAIGACYLALASLEYVDNYMQLKQATCDVFMPASKNHHFYKKKFERYKRLYDLLKNEMTPLQQDTETE